MSKLTKPQMVNDVLNQTTIETSELIEVNVQRTSYGETASGIVYLEYENLFVKVPYDTKAGPDGLSTYITADVGEEVRAEYYDNYTWVQLTEDMLSAAKTAKKSVNVVQKHSDQNAFESIPLEKMQQ